jgi:hypothetical protein
MNIPFSLSSTDTGVSLPWKAKIRIHKKVTKNLSYTEEHREAQSTATSHQNEAKIPDEAALARAGLCSFAYVRLS